MVRHSTEARRLEPFWWHPLDQPGRTSWQAPAHDPSFAPPQSSFKLVISIICVDDDRRRNATASFIVRQEVIDEVAPHGEWLDTVCILYTWDELSFCSLHDFTVAPSWADGAAFDAGKTKSPAFDRVGQPTAYIRRPASDFRSRKKAISQSVCSPIQYTLWWRCYIERYNQR